MAVNNKSASMLDQLPGELLDLVAAQLDAHDLRSLVLTAKQFSELYNEVLLQNAMDYDGKPMTWAAVNGDVALATRVLDLDERRRDMSGIAWHWTKRYETSLLKAADEGEADIIALLLQRLPDLDLNRNEGPYRRSALWSAGLRGHVSALRVLLESGRINADKTDYLGQTALRMAVECHRPDAVRVLLELGADPGVADVDGATPAMAAAAQGHTDILDIFAAHDRDLVLMGDERGFTPLLAAVTRGCVEAVQALAGHGADLCTPWEGQTPLEHTITREAAKLVKCLLEQPAVAQEVNAPRSDGTTLLIAAIQRGSKPTTIRALLLGGADPNLRSSTGASPMTYALRAMAWSLTDRDIDIREPTTARELLLAGADPNRRERPPDLHNTHQAGSPLAEIAAKGHWQLVDYLISLGNNLVDWHAGVHTDTAPLACATRNGHLKVVQSLVDKAGLSPNIVYALDESQLGDVTRDHEGRIKTRACGPAAFIALDRGDVSTVRWLLGSGTVDLAARNAHGRTLLHEALLLRGRPWDQKDMLDALREVGCVPTAMELMILGDVAGEMDEDTD